MPHLFPDFRPGGALVRERIGRIAELIDVKCAGNFCRQSDRHVLIIFRMTARDIGPRHPHFGAECAHVRDFFLRHLVGNDQDNAIAFRAAISARPRPVFPAVASIIVPPGSQFPIALGRFDHRERDTILDRAGRILVLELHEKLARPGVHARDFDERRVADERKNGRRLTVRRDQGEEEAVMGEARRAFREDNRLRLCRA